MNSQNESQNSTQSTLMAQAFTTVWSLAMLLQLLASIFIQLNLSQHPPTLIGIIEFAQLIALLFLFCDPGKTQFMFLAAVLELTSVFYLAPELPNHRILTAFINLPLCLYLIKTLRKTEPNQFVFEKIAPLLRVYILIVYFYVAFHKMNADFFNPAVSCTTVFYGHIREIIQFFPEGSWVWNTLPAFTVIIEFLIPVLLLFPKTRHLGVLTSALFHFGLALDPEKHFFDFTSTMFVLLFAFLPEDTPQKIADQLPNFSKLLQVFRMIFVTAYLIVFFSGFFAPNLQALNFYYNGREIVWWIYGVPAIAILLRLFRGRWLQSSLIQPFRLAPKALWIFPILFFINGLLPYVGIKTRTSLDMYSNLRIAHSQSNHFVLPRTLDPFGYLSDFVRIRHSSDSTLQQAYAESGLSMNYFEFKRYISRHPNISVEFERNGVPMSLERAGDDPELSSGNSWFLEKLLWFRPLDERETSRCQW